MQNIKWISTYAKKYKVKAVITGLLIILNALSIVVIPILSGRIVDVVIIQKKEQQLLPILLIMIGVTLARTVVRYVYQIQFEQMGQGILFDLRNDLYQKMQSLDFEFFGQVRIGDIMARMTGDTDAIRHFLSWVTYNIVECVLWFVVALVVMFQIDWQLTLLLLLVTPFIFVLTQKMSGEARSVFFEIRESFSRMNSMVEENIGGNRIVKAFSRENYEIEKFKEHNKDYMEKNIQSAKVSKKYLTWLEFLANTLTGIALFFGGLFVIQGKMTLGDLVTFNGFLWMLNQPMRMSGWLVNDTERFQASCIKIRELFAQVSRLKQKDVIQESIKGNLSFQEVSFAFSDNPEKMILEDINFQVNQGETVGILGETGSGKSTLMHLIARFFDVTKGEILLDGKNIKDYPLTRVRENVSMVMQDIFLFSDTVEKNIAFARENMDRQELEYFAEIADAHQFISNMPQGYKTIVGERGVGLSGGQKQRISLARALVKDVPILIMDDTTSAVDLETEAKIQQQLANIAGKKTIFIIAHRLSSIRHADLILVMKQGKILEQGTHEELIAKNGQYHEIYLKQVGDAKESAGEHS